MPLVAGLDFGGGAVKACVADIDSAEVLAVAQEPTETSFPAPGRAEFDPGRLVARGDRGHACGRVAGGPPAG